jgi:copper chaperone NosL
VLSLMLALIAGCHQPAPGRIQYGFDACDHCRMTIVDPTFAAQLVTQRGRTYRFDDPGCLVAFVSSGRVADREIHSAWVNDHENSGSVMNVRDVFFVTSDRIKGPMNGHLAAFATRASADAAQRTFAGRLESWDAIVTRGRP